MATPWRGRSVDPNTGQTQMLFNSGNNTKILVFGSFILFFFLMKYVFMQIKKLLMTLFYLFNRYIQKWLINIYCEKNIFNRNAKTSVVKCKIRG